MNYHNDYVDVNERQAMKVDDINCKDTSNEAYECFWLVLSSCHLEDAFLSRLFPGTHSEPIFCISCFLRLVCQSKFFTFIHRQIASWPLARAQLSRFSMRKIGSCKMVEILVINPIKSCLSALFAVCKVQILILIMPDVRGL